jgi:hypothetical protein
MHARMYKIPEVQAAREKREGGLKNTLTFIVGSGLSPGSSSLSAPGTFIYGHIPSCPGHAKILQNAFVGLRGGGGCNQRERRVEGEGTGGYFCPCWLQGEVTVTRV